jgi:tRNA/rRNA methyltransferase
VLHSGGALLKCFCNNDLTCYFNRAMPNTLPSTLPAALPTAVENAGAANAFEHARFILVAPRMAANVGSTARAMKTMGFTQLVLVRPPDDGFQPTFNFKLDHPEAVALASGAVDVLSKARIVDTLDDALAGCKQSVALTARPREWSGTVVQLPQQVARGADAMRSGADIGYVFGNERFGLSNEDVNRCSAICTINVNPDYSSLNLSQAVQVVAYSQRLALVGEDAIATTNRQQLSRELQSESSATHEQIQGMAQHWLDVLESANYYDPALPRRLKERLASLWGRAGLTAADIDMLRGMASALGRGEKSPHKN